MDIAEKILRQKQDFDDVFEAGKKAEYDAFWDGVQENGTRVFYDYGFASRTWKDDNFKPKYDIVYSSSYGVFQDCGVEGSLTEILNENNVALIRHNPEGNTNMSYMFKGARFSQIPMIDIRSTSLLGSAFASKYIITIDEILVNEKTTFANATFSNATELQNLTIDGTIGQNGFDVHWSTKLSADSLKSIVNALSTTTTGLTITLPTTAQANYEAVYGEGSWATLTATRSNWTIAYLSS